MIEQHHFYDDDDNLEMTLTIIKRDICVIDDITYFLITEYRGIDDFEPIQSPYVTSCWNSDRRLLYRRNSKTEKSARKNHDIALIRLRAGDLFFNAE